jgi:flagellar basal body-associated protein FliL
MPGEPSAKAMDSSTKFIIVACVAAFLIIAALAGVYFTVLKKVEATEPEKTVMKYFQSLSDGDMNAFTACFTQQAAPDEKTIGALQKNLSSGTFKYENIKLKTLNQTASDAEVQIRDFTVNASANGQTVKMKMSEIMSGSLIKLKLVNTNGTWLIDTKYQLNAGNGVI